MLTTGLPPHARARSPRSSGRPPGRTRGGVGQEHRGEFHVCQAVLCLLCAGCFGWRPPRRGVGRREALARNGELDTRPSVAERARGRTKPCAVINSHVLFMPHRSASDRWTRARARVRRHAILVQMGGVGWPCACACCTCSLPIAQKGMIFQVSGSANKVTAKHEKKSDRCRHYSYSMSSTLIFESEGAVSARKAMTENRLRKY